MEYQYPIDYHWSTEEIVDVIKFLKRLKGRMKGNFRDEIMNAYRRFKEIVPGKAEEKKICGEFEETSGYSSYQTVKKAKEADTGVKISMP